MTVIATKIPALRFPEFEGEWEIKKVEQVLKRVGKPVTVENDQMYQQIGIRSHGKGLFHKELVTGEELGGKRVFWVVPDSFIVNIVFAWEQAVARTTAFEEGMIASHRFPMFQSQEKHPVDLDFILHFFLTNKGKVILEAASPGGAGRNKTLGQKEFERQKIFYPTLPEQQKIATFLTTIDTRIQQLSRKKGLLEQYKKGVMQQIFSQEIRFKDEDGKEFPAWEEKRLGEIGNFIGGGTPSTGNARYWNGSIPWISSSDLSEHSIYEINATRFISIEAISESATKLIPKNSILIVSRVGVGKIAINERELCTSQDFTNLKLDAENHIFIAYMLKRKILSLLGFNQGTSIKGFLKSDLEMLSIALPSLPEQQKIATFLTTIDRQINLVSQQLERMQTFKKGLLQQMFV